MTWASLALIGAISGQNTSEPFDQLPVVVKTLWFDKEEEAGGEAGPRRATLRPGNARGPGPGGERSGEGGKTKR